MVVASLLGGVLQSSFRHPITTPSMLWVSLEKLCFFLEKSQEKVRRNLFLPDEVAAGSLFVVEDAGVEYALRLFAAVELIGEAEEEHVVVGAEVEVLLHTVVVRVDAFLLAGAHAPMEGDDVGEFGTEATL